MSKIWPVISEPHIKKGSRQVDNFWYYKINQTNKKHKRDGRRVSYQNKEEEGDFELAGPRMAL